jgi:hypothetical protein
MADKRRRPGEPIIIEALGQTWYFSPDVIRELRVTGIDPHDTLKTIILFHGSKRGFENGEYEVESYGIPLRLTVSDNSILVEDPYAW